MNKKILSILMLSAVLFTACSSAGSKVEETTVAETTEAVRQELSANEIAELASSVVTLNVYDMNRNMISTGSGVLVYDQHTIVTNFHVIDEAYSIDAVTEYNRIIPVLGATFYNKDMDLAFLTLNSAVESDPIVIADSDDVKVGDTVYAIGSPLGIKNVVSDGIISAIRDGDECELQTTAPISPGSSGGALLNTYGELVGVTYASYSEGQNLNLAIPAKTILGVERSDSYEKLSSIYDRLNAIGNTLENLSSGALLVETEDFIYEAYNGDCEIYEINKRTGDRRSLNLYGRNLNYFDGVLYYSSKNEKNLCAYDVASETGKTIKLSVQPKKIYKLFVTPNGFTITDSSALNVHLLQYDFDGNFVDSIDGAGGSGCSLYDKNTVVDTIGKEGILRFIDIRTFEENKYTLGFKTGFTFVDNEGIVYVSETYDCCYAVDVENETVVPISKENGHNYLSVIHNGNIYYGNDKGTIVESLFSTSSFYLTKEYILRKIGFTSTGKIYAVGTTFEDEDRMRDGEKYTEYYLMMEPDGSNICILDTAEDKLY